MTNLITYRELNSETTSGLTSKNSFGNIPGANTSFEVYGFEIFKKKNVRLVFKSDLSGKFIKDY
jgi:hypothetical protein